MEAMKIKFTPTKWASADSKAKFFEWLKRFWLKDCPQSLFSNPKYRRLSMMFGHIAHYNRAGFYEEWFTNGRQEWTDYILERGTYNSDPSYTWCDVEKAFIEWLKEQD